MSFQALVKNLSSLLCRKNLIKMGIAFVTAKGIAFLAPFVLALVVEIQEYGKIEFYYSYGRTIGVVLLLGISGAYPYYILKNRDFRKVKLVGAYSFLILLLLLVTEAVYFFAPAPESFLFIPLFSLVSAMMILISSILRTHSKGAVAVLVDSAYYMILLLVSLACVLKHSFLFPVLHILSVAFIVGSALWNSRLYFRYRGHDIDFLKNFAGLMKFSLPLLLSSFIIFWLLACQRIFLKYLLGYEDVGIYSLYFRFAMMPFIIYQFAYIQFFKPLYISDEKKLDRYFSNLMIVVSLVSFVIFLGFPLIWRVYPSLADRKYILVFAVLCCQLSLWVGTALCEGIIGREKLANKMNLLLLPQVVVYPGILFLCRHRMTLQLFTILGFFSFWGVLAVQLFLLKHSCRIFLKKTLIVSCAVSVFPVAATIFMLLT